MKFMTRSREHPPDSIEMVNIPLIPFFKGELGKETGFLVGAGSKPALFDSLFLK